MVKKHIRTFLLAILFLIGAGIFLYPTVSDLWNKRLQAEVMSSYLNEIGQITDYSLEWEKARDYNNRLHTVTDLDEIEALKAEDGRVSLTVKDAEFEPYFEGVQQGDYAPAFVEKNEITLKVPEIPNKEVLTKLKNHPMWQEFNKRCISCGSCTVACSTCTCFTTTDMIYNDNAQVGERRRTTASCQIEGFADMAGGHTFRTTAGERMRYKVLHKFHDYKARFRDYHMCVGCGRCMARCPEFISITATVDKMTEALKEIMAEEKEGTA